MLRKQVSECQSQHDGHDFGQSYSQITVAPAVLAVLTSDSNDF
ncbi:hypothetical protein [Limosilactobacillus vaginalis]